jgi:GNAT acetyltransferase
MAAVRGTRLRAIELMELQAATLFTFDEAGRIMGLNEPGAATAPLVFIGRTAEGVVLRTGSGLDPGAEEAIRAFAATLPPALGPAGGEGERLAEIVSRFQPVTKVHAGPAFVFPAPLFPPMGATRIYPGHIHLLHPELATLAAGFVRQRPHFAVLRAGAAVSVCYSARASARAAEAGVQTAEQFRGLGCAALAADAWAQEIRSAGKTPFYSTNWENTASMAVARKLDLVEFGEDLHVT